MRRYYTPRVPSQAEIIEDCKALATQLEGLNLTVQPNGYGHRIKCDVGGCGWANTH